ncbi:hypothetical protein [uncultured Roseobacter sp.]|uniref:hypothetical protein n=1 Tax=uncultured Roseobacter sp. TaxID=114847 RepID=UPI00262715C1|nr:hypothetical protein [uncultured Roseobacter sp.]
MARVTGLEAALLDGVLEPLSPDGVRAVCAKVVGRDTGRLGLLSLSRPDELGILRVDEV